MSRRQLSAELTAYQSAKSTAHHGEVSLTFRKDTNAFTHSFDAFFKRICYLYIHNQKQTTEALLLPPSEMFSQRNNPYCELLKK